MLKSLASVAIAATLLLSPDSLPAQCGGQGNLVVEIVSITNSGTVPGSEVLLRITGNPNQLVCFACDTGRGAVLIPGIGTICLPVTTNFVELVLFLPPSGVLETRFFLPPEASDAVACCQAFGYDPAVRNSVSFSNLVCFAVTPPCVSGGFAEVGYVTKIEGVTSFPVQVRSTVVGSSGGSGSPVTSVSYDPAAPPTFPVNDNASVFIESIAKIGNDLYVTTLVRATGALMHQSQAGRLPNNLAVEVAVGTTTNAFSPLHVSCSQPLAVGMVFGPFTITVATPFR